MKTFALIFTLCRYAGGGWGGEICHTNTIYLDSRTKCAQVGELLKIKGQADEYICVQGAIPVNEKEEINQP